jgi:hypothetical protein
MFENVIFEESPFGRVSTRGRCGGMAFAALDHFYAGLQMPALSTAQLPSDKGVPPDSHPLARYIYRRQLDSFMVLSAAKYVTWSLSPDDAGFIVRGVTRWTKQDEWTRLRASIDAGKPTVLGLITARQIADLGKNHQVIAYGYDYTPDTDAMTVHIYDVNYPGKEIKLLSDKFRPGWLEDSPNLEQWRGWFVQDYAPHLPPEGLHLPVVIRKAFESIRRAAKPVGLTVTLDRVTFHHPEYAGAVGPVDVALDFNIEGERWRWPKTGQRAVRDGATFKLNKRFALSIPQDGGLNLSAQLSAETGPIDVPGYDAHEFFAFDNDSRSGRILRQFTAAEKWGRGTHEVHSTGSQGTYTLTFTISQA